MLAVRNVGLVRHCRRLRSRLLAIRWLLLVVRYSSIETATYHHGKSQPEVLQSTIPENSLKRNDRLGGEAAFLMV